MSYTNKFEPIKKKITKDVPILITFSTCWYIVKSKFPITTYLEWIKNLFSIVNNLRQFRIFECFNASVDIHF